VFTKARAGTHKTIQRIQDRSQIREKRKSDLRLGGWEKLESVSMVVNI
jgi:hypothetical protein